MAVVEAGLSYGEMRDTYLLPAGPGIAFHGMLFPGCYPTDREPIAARIQDPSQPAPPYFLEYGRDIKHYLHAGLLTQRLMVVYGPEDGERYDPSYVSAMKQIYEELQAGEIEEVRLCWYGLFLDTLKKACGHDSPFVAAYGRGAEADDPKASYWALYPVQSNDGGEGWVQPSVVSMQHYEGHRSLGNLVCAPPFSDGLVAYVNHGKAVFDDDELSTNISELQIPA